MYTASHKFDDSWSSTPDEHWKVCLHCKEPQTKALHSFVEQPDEKHLKSEATCVSVAVYYKACSECGYQLSDTFESGTIDVNNHDLNYHDAKAPTCTESGWKAYETCKREGCNYTSYQGLDALDHDWNDWPSNGDGTHTRQCTVDGCNGSETNDCSGGTATCTEKAVCEVCGKSYGELDPNNHTGLEHIPAKAATEDGEGNTEYWHCDDCGKYYADAEASKEITAADTVTKKLPAKTADTTPVKDASDTKAPGTGDGCVLMICIALMTVSTGTIIALLPKRKKSS